MASFNRLILGDNLEIMKKMDAESVDLIYLDPPFFSNRNYEVIWGDSGEIRSFEDRFSGGISHYIDWLYERVEQMHRVLKSTGSIYLHCDWHADAYIRVMILDRIFGEGNFRGEIVWKRHNAHNDARKKVAVLHDTIWFYSKSEKYDFNGFWGELDEKYIENFYKNEDEKGVFVLGDMSSPNPRPNLMYEWKGFSCPEKGWRYKIETMKNLDEQGRIYYPKKANGDFDYSKRLKIKRYLNREKGQIVGDVWDDIKNVLAQAKERIGYPTQKPEALLERIIKASSNEGDLVFDPFCGGGTTLAVADRLKRRWIGCDQSVAAIKVTEARLTKSNAALKRSNPVTDHYGKTGEASLFEDEIKFSVEKYKYDYDTLRHSDAFAFESFIVQQAGGVSNATQRGDKGIDGKMQDDGTPIQVKRSDRIGRQVIDAFLTAIGRFNPSLYKKCIAEKRRCGTIIAFSFSREIIEEAARLKLDNGVIIDLLCVKDIVPIAEKPHLNLYVEGGKKTGDEWSVEFSAKTASQIDIFQWDFDFDAQRGFCASVLNDKTGRVTQKLKTGDHTIACCATDEYGLESIDSIKIHLNGKIETSE